MSPGTGVDLTLVADRILALVDHPVLLPDYPRIPVVVHPVLVAPDRTAVVPVLRPIRRLPDFEAEAGTEQVVEP